MAFNSGLIYGQIIDQGVGVPGCDVSLNFIIGEASAPPLAVGTGGDYEGNVSGYIKGTTNKDGKFMLPFVWSGVDIGKVQQAVSASLYVAQFYSDNSHRSFNTRLPMYLGQDLKKLIQVGFTDPTGGATDFTNCTKDLFGSYREMIKKKHGVWWTMVPFSSEVFGLIGKATPSFPGT